MLKSKERDLVTSSLSCFHSVGEELTFNWDIPSFGFASIMDTAHLEISKYVGESKEEREGWKQ